MRFFRRFLTEVASAADLERERREREQDSEELRRRVVAVEAQVRVIQAARAAALLRST